MTGLELAEKLIGIDATDGFSKRNPSMTNMQAWDIYMGLAQEALQNEVRPELIQLIAKDFPSVLLKD